MSYQHKMFENRMSILQAFLLIILFYNVNSSFVTLTSEGYENVLVQISDNVSSTNCQTTFNSLQIMLQDASRAICTATKTKAFFRNVTILVPNHWPDNCLPYIDSSFTWPRPHLSDIILNEDHPVFGSRPFSLQYGGCGVNSLAIQLPISFLSSGSARGINLAHEWFHYRYGVFDETGVNEDTLHPTGYKISQPEAPTLPTSCSNVPLQGEWIGNDWENSGDNGNVTSSIMYNTSLTSINLLCTKENHLKAPPTKQNWLCEGHSISEIVNNHNDFLTYNQTKKCLDPLFNIVRNRHIGYHIILDVSAMIAPSLMKSVSFAVSHFIWFLPENSTISIDTFSDTYSQLQTPIILSDSTTKNNVIERVTDVRATSGNTDGLNAALNNAIRLFRTGLDVILITGTESEPSGYDNYVNEFRRNLISPHVLALNIRTTQVLADLYRDGWLYFIPKLTDTPTIESKSKNPQTLLIDTLQSIYSRSRKYRAKVEEKMIELNTGWNNGSFQLDSSGSNLIFAFYPLDGGAGLTFISGSLYGPSGEEECYVVPSNYILLYTAKCDSNTIFEAGIWTYRIKAEGYGIMRLDTWFEGINEVRVLSWTSVIQNKPIDWTIDRLVIYAQVLQQRKAVVSTNPKVYLIGDGSREVVSVDLSENNPSDITKNDGIYSAILTNLPRSSTHFYYIIEIKDGSGIVDEGRYNGQHPMAGSFIPVSMPTDLATKFNRYVYGGSFQIMQPFDERDVSPPARVIDLSINNSNNESVIELKWTAPADNYGLSSTLAAWFIVTCEVDLELIYFNGTLKPSPNSLDNMSVIVQIPVTNQSRNVYYRVYALDFSGNKGQSSNIVTLYVLGVDNKNPDNNNTDSTLPPALFWFLIGLGCVCLIVIIAIVSFFIYRKRQQKKKNLGAEWVQIGETRLDSTILSEKKNESPVLEVPDFNRSTISRRRSSELFTSSRLSSGGYSEGSEIYQQPQVFITSARVETPTRTIESYDSDSELSFRRNTAPVQSLKFGDTWNSSTPSSKVFNGQKKSPPRPPTRKYFPYSSDSNVNRNSSSNLHPLASSPSYLASQLKSSDNSYGENRMSKSNSQLTLTSASNTSVGRFGVFLGADSEVSLV